MDICECGEWCDVFQRCVKFVKDSPALRKYKIYELYHLECPACGKSEILRYTVDRDGWEEYKRIN